VAASGSDCCPISASLNRTDSFSSSVRGLDCIYLRSSSCAVSILHQYRVIACNCLLAGGEEKIGAFQHSWTADYSISLPLAARLDPLSYASLVSKRDLTLLAELYWVCQTSRGRLAGYCPNILATACMWLGNRQRSANRPLSRLTQPSDEIKMEMREFQAF